MFNTIETLFMSRFEHTLLFILAMSWISQSPLAGQQNDISRDNDPLIRSVPSRIMLGSLPYGAKETQYFHRDLTLEGFSSRMSLTNIDLSHAQGVNVLRKDNSSNGIILDLSIDSREFSKDQPYGKFIKRIIRLETNSPDQPEILVPVIGWLDQNETSRNFNTFVFDGSERWRGRWATPNIAGSTIAPIILLQIGGLAWLWTIRTRGLRFLNYGILSLLLIDILLLLNVLAFTYSRGAWIAFSAGCILMIFDSVHLRRIAILALIAFGTILLLLPSGLKRIDSYTYIEQDLSIANRLKLWTGALQMMAEHPIQGVGADQFGPTFERDYQRFDHTTENSTAVSDYFTFGAEYGLLFLGIGIGLLFFIALESFRNAKNSKNLVQMTLTCTFTSILVASAFSTLLYVQELQWILGITLSGLLIYLALETHRASKLTDHWSSLFIRMAKFNLGTVVALGVIGQISLSFLPTKTHTFTVSVSQNEIISCHLIEPRWKPSEGLIIYFPDQDVDPNLVYHSTLRPLAALGWQVVWAPSVNDPTHAETLIAGLGKIYKDKPIFVAGDGRGGRTAWFLAVAMPDRVRAGAGYGFLTTDFNQISRDRISSRPFLVFQSLYDDHTSPNDAIRAQRGDISLALPVTVILARDNLGRFSSGWKDWIQAVSTHFAAR